MVRRNLRKLSSYFGYRITRRRKLSRRKARLFPRRRKILKHFFTCTNSTRLRLLSSQQERRHLTSLYHQTRKVALSHRVPTHSFTLRRRRAMLNSRTRR